MNSKIMKWYFQEPAHEEVNHDGMLTGVMIPTQEIEIPIEKWVWHVVYKDGTELYQFDKGDENGVLRFHQFKEINQAEVAVYELINIENPMLRYSLDVTDKVGMLIHFYRNARLNIGTDHETQVKFYCFGYKIGDVSLYHFVLPDNRIVISTNRDVSLL